MRKFLLLVVAVALLVLGGWAAGIIKFSGDNDKATMEIDKQKASDIANTVKDKMVEGAQKVKTDTQAALNKIENKSTTTVTTTTTPATSTTTTTETK